MFGAPRVVADIGIVIGSVLAIITLIGVVTRWRLTRWVWRQLVVEPGDERFARRATLAVKPLIDGVREAAKAQHDEQNEAIEQGFKSVHHRLDDGSLRMSSMSGRIDALETRAEAKVRTVEIVDAVHEASAGE